MELKDFAGARRIPLIGRQDLLKDASRRIRQGGVHIRYYEGEGGIGKTALLEAILAQSRREIEAGALSQCSVGREIIDLYHVEVHTLEGLIRKIIETLGERHFRESRKALDGLDTARSVDNVAEAKKLTGVLQRVFFREFTRLAKGGIVFALDTMEVLEYARDPFQEELGEDIPILSAEEWLLESFPRLRGNVMLLLAGRPSSLPKKIRALQRRNPHIQFRRILVMALQENETKEYLKAVARAEGNRGNKDATERLWSFCEERGDVVHLLTGGRPILLALVADMVAHGWKLPPAFGHSIEELSQRGKESWQPEMEQALVIRIQESITPIGETIRALAWLPKGATADLLAQVMELKTPDGWWDTDTARNYLDQVAQLTLTKVRPGDQRVFLHDEMHTLIEKYVLWERSEEEKDRVHNSIQEYYRERTGDLERRIGESPRTYPMFQAQLRQAYVEGMHYHLRHRPPMGFAMFFWLAEEALGGRDSEMDMLLRSELLRTVAMLEQDEALAGLDPHEVEIDTAVRWGMRALFFQNDPEEALRIFERIRDRWKEQISDLRLTQAHLDLYRAVAMIQRAHGQDWEKARKILERVERLADEVLPVTESPHTRSYLDVDVTEGFHWRARILKALALNYQGYLDRQQGRYLEAVHHYHESTMLQRRLEMVSLAPTLTNLSYAMALTGQFHHARLLAEEAERQARRSGKEHILALALNTRALVEEYDDHPRAALRYTDRALEIATGLRPRVRGLIYLTRARARRYLWGSLTEEEKKREPKSKSLAEALEEAHQAVNFLKNDPPGRVEALIERGCIHREIARDHHQQERTAKAEKSTQKSQKDLEDAAALAREIGLPSQQTLAWTNLGWLYYYIGRTDKAQEALKQAYSPIPEKYLFPSHGPIPPMAQEERKREARLPFWSTLGKAEMLKAHIALDEAHIALDKEEREKKLREAAKHITLSLAYDEQIADEYFDITRAEGGLHGRILRESLGIEDLHRHAQQVAEEQGLEQPTRFQKFLDRMFGPAELWT